MVKVVFGCEDCRRGRDHTHRGEQAKEVGVEAAIVGAGDYRWAFRARVRVLAGLGEPFTSEDVTSVVGIPNTKAVGALMNAAAREGLIRRLGFVKAERTNQHAALISEWIGVR